MQQGVIQWFSHEKGYGFIKSGEDEYFVHYSAAPKETWGKLNEGQEVSFKLINGPHGSQAAEVRLNDDEADPKSNDASDDSSDEPRSDDSSQSE